MAYIDVLSNVVIYTGVLFIYAFFCRLLIHKERLEKLTSLFGFAKQGIWFCWCVKYWTFASLQLALAVDKIRVNKEICFSWKSLFAMLKSVMLISSSTCQLVYLSTLYRVVPTSLSAATIMMQSYSFYFICTRGSDFFCSSGKWSDRSFIGALTKTIKTPNSIFRKPLA